MTTNLSNIDNFLKERESKTQSILRDARAVMDRIAKIDVKDAKLRKEIAKLREKELEKKV
jgi:hypothetical protein